LATSKLITGCVCYEHINMHAGVIHAYDMRMTYACRKHCPNLHFSLVKPPFQVLNTWHEDFQSRNSVIWPRTIHNFGVKKPSRIAGLQFLRTMHAFRSTFSGSSHGAA